MLQVSESVGTVRTGSMKAVDTSGSSSMSLSLMAWKPRMEDPSKPSPSRIIGSSRVAAGIEKCCQVPGRSQNFTSTTWIFFSLISSSTCCTSLAVDGCGSAVGRTVVAMDLSDLGSEILGSLKDDAPAWARRTRGHQPAQRLLGPRTRRFDRRHAPVSLTTRIGSEADRAVHGVRVWRKFYLG